MKWKLFILTGFCLGHMRPAPGTWGSTPPVIATLMLLWIGSEFDVPMHMALNSVLIVMALVFGLCCIAYGGDAEQHFGRKDASPVVADEIAGQSIALLILPWNAGSDLTAWNWNVLLAATAFFSFRAFDILKPPPAQAAQQLNGGLGILLDDVIAGFYALILTHLTTHFLWREVFT